MRRLSSIAIFVVVNMNRLLYELGVIKSDVDSRITLHRYRLQTGFTLPLLHFYKGNTVNYLLSDEIFVRAFRGNTSTNQNRLLNGVQVKSSRGDLNLAYQYTVQKEGNSYVNKNQLLIIINTNL